MYGSRLRGELVQSVLLLQALAVRVGKSETCSLSQVSCLGDQIQGKVFAWETLQIWPWSDPKAWLEPRALACGTVTHPLQLKAVGGQTEYG